MRSMGREYRLTERSQVARATHRFRFALENQDKELGLPTGQHVVVHLPNSSVSRAYTPTTSDRQKGFFELVVKVYPKGPVSTYLDSLGVGDAVTVSGPEGEIRYLGDCDFEISDPFKGSKVRRRAEEVGMVAGGTGITPMFQIARWATEAKDPLRMSLHFANRAPEDVMLQSELEALAREAKGRFQLSFSADEAQDAWPHHRGLVSEEMLRSALPAPEACKLVCICGPSGFHRAVEKHLEAMGFPRDAIFHF